MANYCDIDVVVDGRGKTFLKDDVSNVLRKEDNIGMSIEAITLSMFSEHHAQHKVASSLRPGKAVNHLHVAT